MQEFTEKDCMQTEKEASIQNRVVVLPSKVLPEHYTGQLFFCTNIQKTENPRHSIAHLVSLSTGEAWHCWNRDVVGVLRPELLGEKERLQLSQIRQTLFFDKTVPAMAEPILPISASSPPDNHSAPYSGHW